MDNRGNTTLHDHGGQAKLCHAECCHVTRSGDRGHIFSVLASDFEPSASELSQRHLFFQRQAASIFAAKFRIPIEIGLLIAEYLPPTTLLHQLALRSILDHQYRGPRQFRAHIRGGVRVQYVTYENKPYVASLVSSGADGGKTHLVPDQPTTPCIIFVGKDYLGVREVLLRTNAESPKGVSRGLWWRTISLQAPGQELVCRSDVGSNLTLLPFRLSS